MIVVMVQTATKAQISMVESRMLSLGMQVQHSFSGEQHLLIGSDGSPTLWQSLEAMPGVERVLWVRQPYKLVSRPVHPEGTVVWAAGRPIGGKALTIIAGPCSVENEAQIREAARIVQGAGGNFLRAGAYKPRSSPYSWQGLGEQGLALLQAVKQDTGLGIVTEVLDPRQIEKVSAVADILQVGARNMHNYELLKALGQVELPVLLKRGLAATVEEWLLAAEYLITAGNPNVILCERGIRTFETYTRNTLDLAAVAAVKNLSHLPVLVDPSHGTGKWQLITPLSRAAIAVGADGLLIEMHPQPEQALSDGEQSLAPDKYLALLEELKHIAAAVGRELP